MSSDISNMLKMMNLLGDDGFVDALKNVEKLVEDVEGTLNRVEQIEGDAEQAVQEANQALNAVDYRLEKFDETISLLEAKIEAGFTVGFFLFGINRWLDGELILASILFFMGLLGVSSLIITIIKLPQVQRLRRLLKYAIRQFREENTGNSSSAGESSEDLRGHEHTQANKRQSQADEQRPRGNEREKTSDKERRSGGYWAER